MAGTIGDNLKRLREDKGLSMAFVAQHLNLSLGAYQKYENNTRDVSTSTLNAIADFYGVTTDYLLGRPDAKPPADPVEEFTDRVQMQEQEQIILKKWLALDEKKRQAVFDFMVDIVHEYESESVHSTAQEQIKKTDTYNSEFAVARSSESNYKPAPTEEQYNSFEELTDDMLGE